MIRPITNNTYARKGFSLVEVMASVAILIVAVIGTSSFRYYTAIEAHRAAKHIAAARIALTLCESWAGLKGLNTFDPTLTLSQVMTIESGQGPATPSGFTMLGNYHVQVDGTSYYTTMAWKDINANLRALNVAVSWSQTNDASTLANTDKSFTLTNYAIR
jgi:prepilin-type N-terminal cleavage/methylation domain-containing protein